jgi:hypothetical protein
MDLKKVVDQLGESEEQKVASNPLFQWHTLRRLSREDLRLFASVATRSGAEVEYAACSLLKEEDTRAQVRPMPLEVVGSCNCHGAGTFVEGF